MAAPTYTAPPNDAPVLGDPDFAANAQGFLGWFPTFGAYCEALKTWMTTEFAYTLGDGSAAAPVVSFSADTNTGLFRPGADQLGISLGGTEVARFRNASLAIGLTNPGAKLHVVDTADAPTSYATASHATFTKAVITANAVRAASAAYNLFVGYSGNSADVEFRVTGEGNATCDGSFTGGGADYAEYFEWLDGNPGGEDRIGVSVVLDGDKIRPAEAGDEPIGVVSANPSVVGDGDMDRWKGKYLRDDYGRYIWERRETVEWTEKAGEVEVTHSYDTWEVPSGTIVPKDAKFTPYERKKLNPEFDAKRPYTPRADRPEWSTIGLIGKLRLRKGQPVGTRWIKMRDVSADVEEWLVR